MKCNILYNIITQRVIRICNLKNDLKKKINMYSFGPVITNLK